MAKRDTGAEQGTIRNFFPSYRVFCEGIELTELCSTVRIQWPTQSPSQCTIELANPADLMTITSEDMVAIAQLRSGTVDRFLQIQQAQARLELEGVFSPEELTAFRQSAGVSEDQFILTPNDILKGLAKQREGTGFFRTAVAIDPITPDLADIKNSLIPTKLDVSTYTQSTTGVDGDPLPAEVFFKYPFVQGKWIWHHGDRVRVAFRHPSDPTIWFWMHAGTLTDISESETEDKMSTLTMVSEGILKDLRNARVVNMTGSYLSPKTFKGPGGEVSTFSDDQLSPILSAVPFSSFLQNLTLFQIIELMIFGVDSILSDLGQAVRERQDPTVIAERFGIPPNKEGVVTDEAIKAREQQLRGLNFSGLSKFKKWRSSQGTEVHILGGPVDVGDTAIGEQTRTLAEWHTLLDNQVRQFDVVTMSDIAVDDAGGPTVNTGGRRLPPELKSIRAQQIRRASSMTIDEVITQIGSNPETYPIRQRVKVLLPANLGSRLGRTVLERDLAGCPASQAEFFDRLSLLQQVIDRIDFCLYDTPRGDLVVEMPLYDFEPRHFTTDGGLSLLTEQLTAGRSILASVKAFLQSTITIRGDDNQFFTDSQYYTVGLNSELLEGEAISNVPDYDTVFSIFNFEQLRIDLSTSEQDVKTAWISVPRFLQGNFKGDAAATSRKRVQTFLPNLVPLYGLRVEQGDPSGQITTEEGARVYNHIQLNKANADATNVRVPCLPNWQAWPNRPVFIESRSIISTTKSVAHTIVWQSDCSTEYGLWHSKFWDGRFVSEREGSVQRPLFVPFGGVNAQPYNFAYLLGIDKVQRALNIKQGQADVQAALAQALGKK